MAISEPNPVSHGQVLWPAGSVASGLCDKVHVTILEARGEVSLPRTPWTENGGQELLGRDQGLARHSHPKEAAMKSFPIPPPLRRALPSSVTVLPLPESPEA